VERRAGELLAVMERSGERAGKGQPTKEKSRGATLKLKDVGISKDQSARWDALIAGVLVAVAVLAAIGLFVVLIMSIR